MLRARRSRLLFAGVLALILSVTAGLLTGGVADAKKKGKRKGVKTFTVTRTVPTPVGPLNQPTGQPGVVKVPIGTVGGKKLKGKVIGFSTVEVTTLFTGPPGFASNILAVVVAPGGRSAGLQAPFANNLNTPSETSSGPTTETPNSATSTCTPASFPGVFVQPPCSDPDATLGPPYAGTIGNSALAIFKGTSPSGTWSVRVFNFSTTMTASLSSITLKGTLINALG